MHTPPESNLTNLFHMRSLQFSSHIVIDIAVSHT